MKQRPTWESIVKSADALIPGIVQEHTETKFASLVKTPAHKAYQAERNCRATRLMEAASVYRPPLSGDVPCRYCGQKKSLGCTCKRDMDNGV